MASKNKREIVSLTDDEHIILRASMYVGSVEQTEEKVPIIENNELVFKNKVFSIGMHKLFGEIVDNSFDELKHLYQLKPTYKGRIIVKIDTSHNLVSVEDNGRGFYKGLDINEKTGLNNIVTAFSQLRAGSNFNNDDEASNLIGTNGVGSSVVNVLSDLFSVETGDGKYKYKHTWAKFETVESETEQGTFKPGTKVIFIPRFDIFDSLWDLELITTNMIFRNMLKKDDEFISNLDFKFYIDDVLVNLDVPFMPKERLLVKNSNSLKVYTWQTTENSTSVSFVNGSMCTGIHQKMMQEIINDKVFDYDKAHYLYETLIVLNLPPKNVKFADQNKTKFSSTRNELNGVLQFDIPDKEIKQIKESEWYNIVYNDIENTLKKEEMSKLKKARKNTKKITDKYFPSQKKENLYLVEGNSARGSILQKRDPNVDAVYTLRGKLKNVKSISDLSSNVEIIDLINILNLNLEDKGSDVKYKRIIIATDGDVDGNHIASLILNFFNKWFPNIIKQGKLYKLITPLVSVEMKGKRKYYYSLDDFSKEANKSNARYLKGLGSNDLKDWEYIFTNLTLERMSPDEYSDKILTIVFGNNANLRKKWLSIK